MKVKVKFLQEGGQAPTPETAPAEGGGAPGQGGQPNPEEQLAQMAQQIVQQLGPEAAAALAQMIMQLLQGGGGAQPEPQGQPVYQKQGGKLVMLGRK